MKIIYDNHIFNISARKQAEALIERQNRARQAISQCNGILVRSRSEQPLLEENCRIIADICDYPCVWIGMREGGETGTLRPTAWAGDMSDFVANITIDPASEELSHCPTKRSLRTSQPEWQWEIEGDEEFAPRALIKQFKRDGLHAYLALPLKEEDKPPFGIIGIYDYAAGAFTPEEIELLTELANDLAYGIVSIRNRRRRQEAEQAYHRSAKQLEQVLVQTIMAIGHTIEIRDPYTAGHQQRVAELATAIAEEMKLEKDRIEGMRLGAMIHDIGKIYIPAEILNRPGKLTEIEFGLIKSHPDVGYNIVKDVDFPWSVAQMILQHHERLDGSGYPNALKGDEIMLEARILAVADVVEAITSHRPYRPALDQSIALEEIGSGRGISYDAAVVDVCLGLFRKEPAFRFQ